MKLSFSTENVAESSFTAICDTACSYGFNGFEIYDIDSDNVNDNDSIFNDIASAGAKRKLVNRHIAVSGLRFPYELGKDAADTKKLARYIEEAAYISVSNVIVKISDDADMETVKSILDPVMPLTEKYGVTLLFETVGKYADTENVIELINMFSLGNVGASWNIRETFFVGKETAEQTIKTLGAYICNVRIGDMKDGKRVLLGDGELPVDEFVQALRSLNYEGFTTVEPNDEINNNDIVFTHYVNFMLSVDDGNRNNRPVQYNRSKSQAS